jgi:hypothetical protein
MLSRVAAVLIPLGLASQAGATETLSQLEKDAQARSATFGLGAIVGVATYNMLTTAVAGGLPAAAVSAVGVVGSIGASTAMVWVRNTYNGERTEFSQLVPVSVGALAGVAAGDAVASSVMGYSPFAAAAGGVMPSFGFSLGGIATSLYVYTTGVMGARVADAAIGIEPQPAPAMQPTPIKVPPADPVRGGGAVPVSTTAR